MIRLLLNVQPRPRAAGPRRTETCHEDVRKLILVADVERSRGVGFGQEIEPQGDHSDIRKGHLLIAGAQPAGAAAVREDDDAPGRIRQPQIPSQAGRRNGDGNNGDGVCHGAWPASGLDDLEPILLGRVDPYQGARRRNGDVFRSRERAGQDQDGAGR